MIGTAALWSARRTVSAQGEVVLGLCAAICTRNRPELLERTLESLLLQAHPPLEIIVVDNAPDSDATRRVVEGFKGARYVKETRAGLDFARNRALREARQPIVAFIDDDAVADVRWSERLLQRFETDERLCACTGRVEALSTEHEGQKIVEANGGYARGLESIVLPRDATRKLHGMRAPLIAWTISIGSGCSLAVRREVALAIGGFDEALGVSALPGGDDHDMLWRLLAAGCDIGYEPAAIAWHDHRHSADAAYAQIVGHQRGLMAFLTKAMWYGSLRQRAGVFTFTLWRLFKPGVRLLRRLAGRDALPAPVLLRMWWNCWRGLFAYPFARLARRRSA